MAWTKIGNVRTIPVIASGSVATPALLLGAATDVTVNLSRAMPDTNYLVEVFPAQAILGGVQTTVKTKNLSSVVVTVKANLLALAAGMISVIAHKS